MVDDKKMAKVHEVGYQMLAWFDSFCRKHDIQYWLCAGALLGAVRHKDFVPWDADFDVWITRTEYDKLVQHLDELPEDCKWLTPTSYGKNRYLDCVSRIQYKYMRYTYCSVTPEALEFYHNVFNDSMHLDLFFLDNTYDDWRGKLQRFEMAFLYGLMNCRRHKNVMIDKYPLHWKICQAILLPFGRCIPLRWLMDRATKVSTRYNSRDDAEYFFVSNAGMILNCIFPKRYFTRTMDIQFGPLTIPVTANADEVLRIQYGDYMKLPPKEEQGSLSEVAFLEPSEK